MLDARSKERFPTLAPPFCPWHTDCTAMDCENFRTFPKDALVFGPLLTGRVQTLNPLEPEEIREQAWRHPSVPVKPSKKGKKR